MTLLTTPARRLRNRLFPGLLIGALLALGVEAQDGAIPDKSRGSTAVVAAQFQNTSTDVADGFWIDFEGNPRHYFTLPPGASAPIQTFSGHVWHWYVNDVLTRKFVVGEGKQQTFQIEAPPSTGPLRLLLPTELSTKHPGYWESVLVTQTNTGVSRRRFSAKSGGLPIDALLVTPVIELTSRADGPQQQKQLDRLNTELQALYAGSPEYAPEIKQEKDGLDRQCVRITFPPIEMVDPSRQTPPAQVGVWKPKNASDKPSMVEIPAVQGGVPTPCLQIPWLTPEVEQTFEGAFYSHLVVRQTASIGAEKFEYESELDLVRKGQRIESPQRRLTFIRIDPGLLTWNQSSPQLSPLTKTSVELTQGARSLTQHFEPYKQPNGTFSTPLATCWPVLRPNFDQEPAVIANIQFVMADNQTREWPESGRNLFGVVGPEMLLELVDFDWIFDPPLVTY